MQKKLKKNDIPNRNLFEKYIYKYKKNLLIKMF